MLVASFARNPHPWAAFLRGLVLCSWVASLFPALSHAKALLGGYATPSLRTLLRRARAGLPAAVLARRLRAVASCDVCAEFHGQHPHTAEAVFVGLDEYERGIPALPGDA